MKAIKLLMLTSLSLFLNTSCSDNWLEEKRDISLVVPSSLEDLRLMLNNSNPLLYELRGLAELSSDDIYFTNNDWKSKIALERYAYIWSDKMFEETTYLAEWDDAYKQVFIANIVLEGLGDIEIDNSNREEWNDIKGAALYYRARAFYNLAQQFCAPFSPNTVSEPGIPLRLSSNIHSKSERATVQSTYGQIIADLEEASKLLRSAVLYKTNISRPAAYALLARCHLSMSQYNQALNNATRGLELYDQLIDYNTLEIGSGYSFELFNEEVILYGSISSNFIGFRAPTGKIDSVFYNSYKENDLRKKLFFIKNEDNSYSFRGSYSGGSNLFGGIATDEMYLIRAECYVRNGNIEFGMDVLNTLLTNRYENESFEPVSALTTKEALKIIYDERRKELLMRGLRWSDLRRLNTQPDYSVEINRLADGELYTLESEDSRYVLPIPEYIIESSGIEQNNR